MVYAATNPVTAGLVERAVDGPGVNGYALLLADQPVTLARPTFSRPKGKMPATVTLNLVIPPELGERAVILRELEARIAAREAELVAAITLSGAPPDAEQCIQARLTKRLRFPVTTESTRVTATE